MYIHIHNLKCLKGILQFSQPHFLQQPCKTLANFVSPKTKRGFLYKTNKNRPSFHFSAPANGGNNLYLFLFTLLSTVFSP